MKHRLNIHAIRDGSVNVDRAILGDDVIAYINNVNLGSGLITSATPWVIV